MSIRISDFVLRRGSLTQGLSNQVFPGLTSLWSKYSSHIEAGISFLLKGQFTEQPSKKSTVVNKTFAKLGNGPPKVRSVRLFKQMTQERKQGWGHSGWGSEAYLHVSLICSSNSPRSQ